MTRTLRTTLLATALLALAEPPAHAGTASSDGMAVAFADPAGAVDDLVVTTEDIPLESDVDGIGGWRVSFLQFAPPTTPGPGFHAGFVSTVCPFGAGPPGAVTVDLGGGDDRLRLVANTVSPSTRFTALGGSGADLIETYQTSAPSTVAPATTFSGPTTDRRPSRCHRPRRPAGPSRAGPDTTP